jgi:hypothetical protein
VLQQVSLEIPPQEADRSIEFWSLLGFEEVDSPEPLGDAVRWLEREGTQIHLILTEGHTAQALDGSRPGGADPHHFRRLRFLLL